MKRKLIYLAVTLVLLTAEVISIRITMADKSNAVEFKQGGIADNYYSVEASWSKMWHDTWHSGAKWLVILGFVLSLAPAAGAFYFDGLTSKGGGSYALWALAVLSAVFVFASLGSKNGSSSYQSNICPEEYEVIKHNPDSIFPREDKALKCK